MRILLAGAGGAIGQRTIPALVLEGHVVGALTRSEGKREALLELGAAPFIADALDSSAVESIVESFRPDTIIHMLTAIPQSINLAHFDREFTQTNRLRRAGTDYLIAAAKKWNVQRFVAQSFGGLPYALTGGAIKSEDDPFDSAPPRQLHATFDALRHLEERVISSFPESGTVLRYGWLYGPRTSLGRDGAMANAVRKRMLPVVARGTGIWSFLHVEDAATAAVAALHGKGGIYNIADDEPALVCDWIETLAKLLAAKPPRHVPAWLARFMIGEHGVAMMRDNRGLSSVKAKRELAWAPRYPNWRVGFRTEFGESATLP